jgi:hypothetical protein
MGGIGVQWSEQMTVEWCLSRDVDENREVGGQGE